MARRNANAGNDDKDVLISKELGGDLAVLERQVVEFNDIIYQSLRHLVRTMSGSWTPEFWWQAIGWIDLL
jgi:hypothetical protein